MSKRSCYSLPFILRQIIIILLAIIWLVWGNNSYVERFLSRNSLSVTLSSSSPEVPTI